MSKRTDVWCAKSSASMKAYWKTARGAEHIKIIRRCNTKKVVPKSRLLRGHPSHVEEKYTLRFHSLRRCRKCNVIRHVTDFREGAYRWRCRKCENDYQRQHRKKDTNTEALRRRAKKWREAHVEVAKARVAACQKKNPEVRAQARRKRRALVSNNGVFKVTKQDLFRLMNRQHNECYLCSAKLTKSNKELDHIIPIVRGGRHSIGNFAWSCLTCNRRKSKHLLSEVLYGAL